MQDQTCIHLSGVLACSTVSRSFVCAIKKCLGIAGHAQNDSKKTMDIVLVRAVSLSSRDRPRGVLEKCPVPCSRLCF